MSEDVVVTGVLPAEMPAVWPKIEPFFQQFVERANGETTVAQLLDDVLQRRRQCWVVLDGEDVIACAMTRIDGADNPMKTVQIDMCTGRDRELWRDVLVEEIDAWRKHIGSRILRIVGRPGWARELKPMGFKETHRVMERIDADV